MSSGATEDRNIGDVPVHWAGPLRQSASGETEDRNDARTSRSARRYRVAVALRVDRGSQNRHRESGHGAGLAWRWSSGAKDLNFGMTSPSRTDARVASPSAATEDCNPECHRTQVLKSLWWSLSGATEDRNLRATCSPSGGGGGRPLG
ncbi:hypothetical protein GCM10022232_58860 [Streptomyces plumbiresistens]|uniref:Uncharacterized protein n=1 Tax=Streptomyces plumbiresistens TaxID=511811 RepID=A0ABP7SDC7_9ACTN